LWRLLPNWPLQALVAGDYASSSKVTWSKGIQQLLLRTAKLCIGMS
jgi:hypothetical protein